MDIKETDITVPYFRNLIALKDVLKDDSDELLADIETRNPFAREMCTRFLQEIAELDIFFTESI